MDKKNKHDVVVAAVAALKNSEFHATAIKVELEAQLGRAYRSTGSQDDWETCPTCEGDGWSECEECNGNGTHECAECEGEGRTSNPDYISEEVTPRIVDRIVCEDCDGEGEFQCSVCDGDGRRDCPNSDCDDGQVPCGSDSEEESYNWGNDRDCHDFILKQLVAYDLAEKISEDDGYAYARKYRPKFPLVYSKFYNDGSVDSELTFTLSLKDTNTIFLLPHFLEAFKNLAEKIGGGFNVDGAGMHMALLNNPDCTYPISTLRTVKLKNFDKSMRLLLPALYFLGSNNEHSRSLQYRQPKVASGSHGDEKYGAIRWYGGALEFRVFQTCYDNPEAILDNVVVMQKCVRYWSGKYINPRMDKITKDVHFGNENGNSLGRLYCTAQHIDLLNRGLTLLKPSYYSVTELKAQRKFKVNKQTIKGAVAKCQKDAHTGYKEYEHRFNWNQGIRRHYFMANGLEERQRNQQGELLPIDEIERQLAIEVEETLKREEGAKLKLETYVQEQVAAFEESQRGRYRLALESE